PLSFSTQITSSFFFIPPRTPRHLHSFPTRRSSDLVVTIVNCLHILKTLPKLSTRKLNALSMKITNVLEKFLKHTVNNIRLLPKPDRKSTRLNSSHVSISYAVFCLKKKKTHTHNEAS